MTDFELVRLSFHEPHPSPGFVDWLGERDLTIAASIGGALFFVGRGDEGLSIHETGFGLSAGLAPAGPDTLYLATRFQIWRLENAQPSGSRTPLFIPQSAWTTGFLAVPSLSLRADGSLVFPSTRFSCVATVDERYNFRPVWMPPFVSRLAPEDRCHLTGLAVDEGVPAYVTCAGRTDTPQGWMGDQASGGVVVSVPDGEVVASGLSLPHSPTIAAGRLWLANAGTGEWGFVDRSSGRFEAVGAVPGFCATLAVSGTSVVVGSSRPGRGDSFDDLPLERRLAAAGTGARCGIHVFDLDSGRLEHALALEGGAPDVHDLAFLPGVASARAVGFTGDDVQELVTVPLAD